MTDDLIARLRDLTDENFGELDQFSTWGREMVAAADALEAQARRIAELEEEWEDLEEKTGDIHLRYYEKIKTLYARIAELEAALHPFADVADYTKTWAENEKALVPVFCLRAARAALGEKE